MKSSKFYYVLLIILSSLPALRAHGTAGFCASQNDPTETYCEDFSGATPLAAYTVTNPTINPLDTYSPYGFIGIINDSLVFNQPTGFSVANAVYNTALEWQDSSIETSIKFNTSNPNIRNLIAPGWMTTAQPPSQTYISWGLQLDEQRAYLFIVLNGSLVAYQSVSYPVEINKSYLLRLDIEGNNKVRGYIGGVPQLSLDVDLSRFPQRLPVGFGGDSYSGDINQVYEHAYIKHKSTLSCVGFDSPMDSNLVKVNKNRALPLKASLFDNHGTLITDSNISAPPALMINYDSGTAVAVDVSSEALPAGLGTTGNQFVFQDGMWRFNLLTKNYTAPGIYTITMVPGNNYFIKPTCTARFQIK